MREVEIRIGNPRGGHGPIATVVDGRLITYGTHLDRLGKDRGDGKADEPGLARDEFEVFVNEVRVAFAMCDAALRARENIEGA